MHYSKDQQISQLVADLVRAGWSFIKGKKHGKLSSPNGHIRLIVPATPSDRRAFKNFRGDVRRHS